jgi:hypothetical protein
VCKGPGLMCGVVRWVGYCVRAGYSVQGYRVNVWSFTSSLTYSFMMYAGTNKCYTLLDCRHIVLVHTDMCYCHGRY